MSSLLDNTLRAFESTIDFPQEGLDPVVWIKNKRGEYTLSPGAERKIFSVLAAHPYQDLVSIAKELRIVGSMASNQWNRDTDIDVHLVPENPNKWSDNQVLKVKGWFDKHREEIGGFIGQHPVEIYIQTNPSQDLLSVGVYDILRHQWIKGPKIVPPDYDPYQDFSDLEDDIRATVEDADKLFAELKRDTIDFEVIKSAMARMSPQQRQNFKGRLESKLQEIESGIEQLYRVRGEMVQKRKLASAPTTPEEALHDVELAKKWKDTNALFKFIARYQYLRVIGELKNLLDDEGEISPDDIDAIKRIAGVPHVDVS